MALYKHWCKAQYADKLQQRDIRTSTQHSPYNHVIESQVKCEEEKAKPKRLMGNIISRSIDGKDDQNTP